MELYRQYLQENYDYQLIYNKDSFITYEFTDDYVYIIDIFVVKEKRKSGLGKALGEQVENIAKELGYNKVVGSVCKDTNDWQSSLEVLKRVGYAQYAEDDEMIWLVKYI
jgi:GNAT superfamily N-acetyltransferase